MQPHFKTAALRNLNNNEFFLEILLQSCLSLGREGWSWAECYMLHELICLFICFWLIAHLQVCEKWQSVNILPLMGHVTDAQHSRLKRSIWVLQTLLTARFTDGWQSSTVLTKMLLTLIPNMLDGFQFTAVRPGYKIQKTSMFLGGEGRFLNMENGSEAEISKEKCFGNVYVIYRKSRSPFKKSIHRIVDNSQLFPHIPPVLY